MKPLELANVAMNTAILSLAIYTHIDLQKTNKNRRIVFVGMTATAIAVSAMQTSKIIKEVRKERKMLI
jgi:ABC-type molybdate transport system permease subunit